MFEKSAAYGITLTNITNPNSASLEEKNFKITAYFDEDIYENLIIAQSLFSPPDISLNSVKDCETFEVSLGAYNPAYTTNYDITLICPNLIKSAS